MEKLVATQHVRPVDQELLNVLRNSEQASVPELTESLGVTATAIRQRLERLVEQELVEREKEVVGRGRPQFRYRLTRNGLRQVSANYADLATALWQEVLALPSPPMRRRFLQRVAKRMGKQLLGTEDEQVETVELQDRVEATVNELLSRQVAVTVGKSGEMPVLEVRSCPYPELVAQEQAENGSRQICELEQEMLSNALGQSVQLDCCHLDGHDCCQFRPVPGVETHQLEESKVIGGNGQAQEPDEGLELNSDVKG